MGHTVVSGREWLCEVQSAYQLSMSRLGLSPDFHGHCGLLCMPDISATRLCNLNFLASLVHKACMMSWAVTFCLACLMKENYQSLQLSLHYRARLIHYHPTSNYNGFMTSLGRPNMRVWFSVDTNIIKWEQLDTFPLHPYQASRYIQCWSHLGGQLPLMHVSGCSSIRVCTQL